MELLIGVIGGLTSILMAVLVYSLNQTIGRINDKIDSVSQMASRHIQECDDRMSRDEIEGKLDNNDDRLEKHDRFMHWTVSSILIMAKEASIILPNPPFD